MATIGSMGIGGSRYYEIRYGNGTLKSTSTPVTGTTATNLSHGNMQYLNPLPTGKFTPGEFRINDVVIRKVSGVSIPGMIQSTVKDNTYYVHRGYNTAIKALNVYLDYPSWPSQEAEWVLQKAKAKMLESDADIALMLAEATETLHMLRNPLKGFHDYLKKLRKLSRSQPKNWNPELSFLANAWLLYRYGISPFISDIESIMQLVNGKLKERVPGSLIRKKSGLDWVTTRDWVATTQSYGGLYLQPKWVEKTTYVAFGHTYARAALEVSSDFRADRFGFDPRQMPALAWEVIPYSFVIDWFASVGAWLRAIMPLINATHLGDCVSVKSTRTVTQTLNVLPLFGRSYELGDPGTFTWTCQQLERRTSDTTPVVPAFTIRQFGFKQLLDSLALLWGATPHN